MCMNVCVYTNVYTFTYTYMCTHTFIPLKTREMYLIYHNGTKIRTHSLWPKA